MEESRQTLLLRAGRCSSFQFVGTTDAGTYACAARIHMFCVSPDDVCMMVCDLIGDSGPPSLNIECERVWV